MISATVRIHGYVILAPVPRLHGITMLYIIDRSFYVIYQLILQLCVACVLSTCCIYRGWD